MRLSTLGGKIIRVLAVALMVSTSLGPSVKPREEGRQSVRAANAAQRTDSTNRQLRVAAVVCFLKGEQTSGMNKICYYDCLGSAAAITISAVELCPLSITR